MKLKGVREIEQIARHVQFDSLFSLPEFLKAYSIQTNGYSFYLVKDDVYVPVILTRGFLKIGEIMAPPFTPGDNINSKTFAVALWSAVDFLKKQLGCSRILINQRPWDPRFNVVYQPNWRKSQYIDLKVSLKPPLEDLYQGFKKRHRYSLRKATGLTDSEISKDEWTENSKVQFRDGSDRNFIRAFLQLFSYTKSKIISERGFVSKFVEKIFHQEKRIETSLLGLCREGFSHVFLGLGFDGSPQSVAVIFLSGNRLSSKMALWSAGANSPLGLQQGIPISLQWYIMSWLRKNNYTDYYLGGIKENGNGPSLFKAGFGGVRVDGYRAKLSHRLLRIIERVGETLAYAQY